MQTTAPIEPYRTTLGILARRWSSAGPLLAGFPLLAGGRPVSVGEIAKAAHLARSRVEAAVDAARCERDANGRLTDLYGLTLAPTLHRLTIEGKTLFACCALWAHVVPKLVGSTVRVESVDPVQRELVRLSISPEGVESAEPSAAVATLAVATQDQISADVGCAFCSQVRHFVSGASAAEFAAIRPSCQPVGIADLQQAAEELYHSIWASIEG